MVRRRKRLEKGIESISKQIDLHEKKMADAFGEDNLDLEKYYEKEIKALRKVTERKKKMKEKSRK